MRIHRVKEIAKPTSYVFPVANWRKDMTTLPEPISPGIDMTFINAAPPVEEAAPEATPSGSPEGSKEKYEDIQMPLPRGSEEWIAGHFVRASPGTSRPPGVLPSIWRTASTKQKREANELYEAKCEEAQRKIDAREAEAARVAEGSEPASGSGIVYPAMSAPGKDSMQLAIATLLSALLPQNTQSGELTKQLCGALQAQLPKGSASLAKSCRAAPAPVVEPVAPKMPTVSSSSSLHLHEHRPTVVAPESSGPFTLKGSGDMHVGAVATKVSRKDWMKIPKAKAAMDKEWDKLINCPRPDPRDKEKGVFDMASVQELSAVKAEAKRSGTKMHHGHLAQMCTVKHSELPDDDPKKVYKGRDYVLGDQIKDESNGWAEFASIGSTPPSLAAGMAIDAVSCLPGYVCEAADAKSAYTQAYYKGVPLWISIPRERWPKAWEGKYTTPVVRLVLNLYGIEHAGDIWQEAGEKRILSAGWLPISKDDWKSVYYHPKHAAFLEVYVDDFKMAAPEKHISTLWQQLKELIVLDGIERDARFLGCDVHSFEATSGQLKELLEWHPSHHRRPHLTKNDINGEMPRVDQRPKTEGSRQGLRHAVFRRLLRRCILRTRANSQKQVAESRDPVHRRNQRPIRIRSHGDSGCGAP